MPPQNTDAAKLADARKELGFLKKRNGELTEKLDLLDGALPRNAEVEKGVLSCCLQFPVKVVPVVRDRFMRDGKMGLMFFDVPRHKILWQKMLSLWTVRGAFDLIILTSELADSGQLEKVGGPQYISELLNEMATESLLDHYLAILEDSWRRRCLWQTALGMRDEALDGDVGRCLVKAAKQIEDMRGRILGEVASADIQEAIDYLEEVPHDCPVFVCERKESVDLIRSLDLGVAAISLYATDLVDELRSVFSGMWFVAVVETGSSDSEVKSWLRAVFDWSRRLGFVDLPRMNGLDLAEFTLEKYVDSMVSGGMSVRDAGQHLRRLATDSQVPEDVVFDSLYVVGAKGGVTILQKKVASRLVKYHDLHYAGNFWKWNSGGVWESVRTDEAVERWVKNALSADGMTLPSVSKSLVDSVGAVMKSEEFSHPDDLNALSDYVVNCKNGMLNVYTGELSPHRRDYLSTAQVQVDWDPESECPTWMAWLDEMKPKKDEQEQIQEMFGYCLVPAVNYHVFFFLFGPGGTGKSTCVEVLQQLVGEQNTLALQLEELGNPFTRSQLVGKQVYLCGELTRQSFKHIGMIKQIAAGEPVYVDVKNKKGFSFRPQGRFVMTSNVVAHTPDTSSGFERRFLQINFKNAIARDKMDFSLPDKLAKELPGIFRWAVEGFNRLKARGHFAHTAENIESIQELMRHRNQVSAFRSESQGLWVDWDSQPTPERKFGCCTPNEDLFNHWTEWCLHNGVKPFTDSQIVFFRELFKADKALEGRRARGIWPYSTATVDSKKVRYMKGVELLTPPDEDADVVETVPGAAVASGPPATEGDDW